MKPVDQTIFGAPEGNCFQACMASLLERPLESIPHFCKGGNPRWAEHLADWLRAEVEMYPIWLKITAEWWPDGIHVLSGKSPRGDFLHSVIAHGDRIIHDPHPSRDGVLTRVDAILLVPINPAKLAA